MTICGVGRARGVAMAAVPVRGGSIREKERTILPNNELRLVGLSLLDSIGLPVINKLMQSAPLCRGIIFSVRGVYDALARPPAQNANKR